MSNTLYRYNTARLGCGSDGKVNEGDTTMTNVLRRNASRPGGASAFFASRILILFLAVILAPAFAAAQSERNVAKAISRLASLQIEIWPEFDRPAAALVILKGEIAANVPLPAAVSLRIAASSGGPTAVAYSAEPGGNLLNLPYDRKDAGDFITLKFDAPGRVFHIEFYDPLVTSAPARSYTYVWTGDMAADRLSVVLQEPAGAIDVSVLPPLGASAVGQDGLRYRSAELGTIQAENRMEVTVRYTKTDPRASVEIVKPKSPDASPLPAAGPSKMELAIWLIGIVAVLGLGAWAAMMWWYGRERRSESPPSQVGFCPKCGAPSASGDRFCSKCGALLA